MRCCKLRCTYFIETCSVVKCKTCKTKSKVMFNTLLSCQLNAMSCYTRGVGRQTSAYFHAHHNHTYSRFRFEHKLFEMLHFILSQPALQVTFHIIGHEKKGKPVQDGSLLVINRVMGPNKCPWKWVTGVITPISGVITLLISGYKPFRPFVKGTTPVRGLTNHGY